MTSSESKHTNHLSINNECHPWLMHYWSVARQLSLRYVAAALVPPTSQHAECLRHYVAATCDVLELIIFERRSSFSSSQYSSSSGINDQSGPSCVSVGSCLLYDNAMDVDDPPPSVCDNSSSPEASMNGIDQDARLLNMSCQLLCRKTLWAGAIVAACESLLGYHPDLPKLAKTCGLCIEKILWPSLSMLSMADRPASVIGDLPSQRLLAFLRLVHAESISYFGSEVVELSATSVTSTDTGTTSSSLLPSHNARRRYLLPQRQAIQAAYGWLARRLPACQRLVLQTSVRLYRFVDTPIARLRATVFSVASLLFRSGHYQEKNVTGFNAQSQSTKISHLLLALALGGPIGRAFLYADEDNAKLCIEKLYRHLTKTEKRETQTKSDLSDDCPQHNHFSDMIPLMNVLSRSSLFLLQKHFTLPIPLSQQQRHERFNCAKETETLHQYTDQVLKSVFAGSDDDLFFRENTVEKKRQRDENDREQTEQAQSCGVGTVLSPAESLTNVRGGGKACVHATAILKTTISSDNGDVTANGARRLLVLHRLFHTGGAPGTILLVVLLALRDYVRRLFSRLFDKNKFGRILDVHAKNLSTVKNIVKKESLCTSVNDSDHADRTHLLKNNNLEKNICSKRLPSCLVNLVQDLLRWIGAFGGGGGCQSAVRFLAEHQVRQRHPHLQQPQKQQQMSSSKNDVVIKSEEEVETSEIHSKCDARFTACEAADESTSCLYRRFNPPSIPSPAFQHKVMDSSSLMQSEISPRNEPIHYWPNCLCCWLLDLDADCGNCASVISADLTPAVVLSEQGEYLRFTNLV